MGENRYPPEGSAIALVDSMSGIRYAWPNASRGGGFVVAFLIVWLVGWGVGEIFAVGTLLGGAGPGGGMNFFMLIWLTGWTIGGAYCMVLVYLYLRRQRPAFLELGRGEIIYETGTRKPDMRFNERRNDFRSVFAGIRSKQYRIPVRECRNLKLERVGEDLRLSVDHDSERIVIGASLGEPDKEWLHGLLAGVIRES